MYSLLSCMYTIPGPSVMCTLVTSAYLHCTLQCSVSLLSGVDQINVTSCFSDFFVVAIMQQLIDNPLN